MDGPWREWSSAERSAATIGVFDGVHRGHRALIDHLDEGHRRTVLTFDPHPVEVLRPGTPPRLITTIEERLSLLEEAGVDAVGILDLGEVKDLAPETFVEELLVGRLGLAKLVLGPDFRFGRDRTGDIALLHRLAPRHGFEVETVELVSDDGAAVSSSRVRSLIEAGRVREAAHHLTRRFTVTGPVIHGDERGASIGYPTANLRPPPRKVVPGTGVYAAYAHVGGEAHQAAVNVGVRPTFGGGELLIEAYLMDFDADLYDQRIGVEFVDYLRPELDFDRVEDLVSQMGQDVSESRELLESTAPDMG